MPKPIRLFNGNTKPHEPFWRFRNAAASESGEPELEFYGYISEYSWFEDDITPQMFKDDLYKNGNGGPVTIRINSGGGDVVAASVIRSVIVDYPGKITVRIDGLCASAATFVAIAGDHIRMQDTAFFMIHDPIAVAMGTVDEIKRVISLLETVKGGIVDAYRAKTKLDGNKLSKMMNRETWMTAKEAKDFGFIDEVISTNQKVFPGAENVAITNALRNYDHVPADLLARLKPPEQRQAEEPYVALRAEAHKILLTRGEAWI
jgi:ATP-dependent Clp protease protease subunit